MTPRERRSDCAVAATLDLVGDRWSLLIVRDLLAGGELRFADLSGSAERIPTNTLTDRLRRLEEAGILERSRYGNHPRRFGYRLSPRGRELGRVVDAMADWGVSHLDRVQRLHPTPPRGK